MCAAGWKAITKSAAVGGVLLALIEGLGVVMNNYMAPPPGAFDEGEGRGMARTSDKGLWLCVPTKARRNEVTKETKHIPITCYTYPFF